MSHWVGACLVSIALATPSHAQEQPTQGNGAALVANCRANSPVCGAYLQGVLDMMIVARRDECAAPRYDRSAMRTAYLRWADANGYFWTFTWSRVLSERWRRPGRANSKSASRPGNSAKGTIGSVSTARFWMLPDRSDAAGHHMGGHVEAIGQQHHPALIRAVKRDLAARLSAPPEGGRSPLSATRSSHIRRRYRSRSGWRRSAPGSSDRPA